jgi:hypothetical protein
MVKRVEMSQYITIDQAIPQGRILSPILFECCINDLSEVVRHCRSHLCADDQQIYTVGLGKSQEAVERDNSD